ncbi:MAG: DUF5688 family protein [Acetivibrio sp.]
MPKEFLEQLAAIVEKRKGKTHDIRTTHVVKNNGTTLDGLTILEKGETIAPTIYVNEYYTLYLEGKDPECIADDILLQYEEAVKNQIYRLDDATFSLSVIQEKIIYRLVNFEKNKKELKKLPYIPFLDLAITFHCLIGKGDKEIGTIRVTMEMMEQWKFDIKKLWKTAKKNTETIFPAQIRPMEEVICGIFEKEENSWMPMEKPDFSGPKMYIASNKLGINGAATLLYEKTISSFAQSCQCDFYILPSSIHELILIPYQESITKEDLCEMVRDVNRTQVPEEDILSDNVYFYSRKKGICPA